ncbi:hypothetical protein F511_11902 [Dorcoceras hygrometricum]|uniref:Uncharacterized protein n=1 Tax=Dorcoceras hygrometricum TaxID=472368 RepID=A0A2Z7B1P0_9LAMI|nr:hypothetical protein F511_11902 [Dorcoceras hygrometricum]
MVEQHMFRVIVEHWQEFNNDKPSANQDLLSIRLLEAELAKARRCISLFQAKSDLPITFPERSTNRATTFDISHGISWPELKAQLTHLTFQVTVKHPAQVAVEQQDLEDGKEALEHQAPEDGQRDQEALEIEHQARNEEHQVQTVAQSATEDECQIDFPEAVEDFAQAGPQPVKISSIPTDFHVVSEFKPMKKVMASLELEVNLMRDDQRFFKYNSQVFRQAFYKKMDVMETNIVRQFTESQQHLLDFVKLKLAEFVNYFKEISDAKNGEAESSKKRRL